MSIHLFCLPRKKSLNLQVEIILGIISVITLHSLIGLNCSIFWIQHLSDFPGLLSWLSFHIWFFFNVIWFVSILFRHQTLQKAGLILFDGQTVLFGRVWWEFCFAQYIVHRKYTFTAVNYLLPTRVIALQVVRTSFLAPRPCYFPLPPLVLTLYV